jgi:hypothetical protein
MTKMKTKLIFPVLAALLAATVSALGANTTFFTSIGDLIFPFSPPARSGAAGAIDNMTIGATTPRAITGTTITGTQLLGPWGTYVKTGVPQSPYTFTFGDNQAELLLEPATTLTYEYITLAPNPGDGMRQCVYSTAAVTSVYLSASAGQSLNNAITTLAANARNCYTYSLSNTTWDRSQ